MKPACLPEQLLCSADGAPPARASAWLDGLVRGPVRAAFERRRIEPGARQHAACHRDMPRLAAVAGAGERQFLVAETVAVGRAALDQRQRLQRLHGRARKDRLPRHRRARARPRRRHPPPRPRRDGGSRPACRAGLRPAQDYAFVMFPEFTCHSSGRNHFILECHDPRLVPPGLPETPIPPQDR